MDHVKQNKIKFSSLSANSVPFSPNTHIDPGQSTHPPLSVNVAEFVPSWYKKEPPLESFKIKNKPKASNTFSQSKRNNIRKPDSSNPGQPVSPQNKQVLTKVDTCVKKKHSLPHSPPNEAPVVERNSDLFKDESEFPVLSTISSTKTVDFAVSFSEKLKSSNEKIFRNRTGQHGIHVINAKEDSLQKNDNKQSRQKGREKDENKSESTRFAKRPWSESDGKNMEFRGLDWAEQTEKNWNEMNFHERNESKKLSRIKSRVNSQRENEGNLSNDRTSLWTTDEMSRRPRRHVECSSEKQERTKDLGNKMNEQTKERNQSKNCQKRQPNTAIVSCTETKISSKSTRKIKQDGSAKPSSANATKFDGSSHQVSSPRRFMSYSDMLKKRPEVQLPVSTEEKDSGILRVPKEQYELADEPNEIESKSKKKKKKKKKPTEITPQPVKKTKEPIMFDFGDMFEKLERKSVIRAGVMPLPAEAPVTPKKEAKVPTQTKAASSNPLDSTAPIIYRKKERELPKKKKQSAMRKIVMKDREERKMARDGETDVLGESEDENADIVNDESPSPEDIKKSIHSRRFREYCDHTLDYDINGAVITLLKELIRFQDRLYQKDPVKAKAKRRFVCGLREVHKHVKLKKIKCVIVTPNMEPTKSKGSPNDVLTNIIELCHSQNVPVVFSVNRQTLGKVLMKKVPVSIVGIFSYDGAQNHFKIVMELTEVARKVYQDKFEATREKLKLENEQKISKSDGVKEIREEEFEKYEYGTEEKLEEYGTEERLEECGTEEKLEECGTEEKLEECGTEGRLEECGTEERLEECGTEVNLEKCGTEETLEECGTEVTLEECGTEERLEECGTEEKLEECGTEVTLKECGTEEKLEECGTEEKLEECGTEETLEEYGTEERLEECGTEEKLEECGTEETLEEYGTEERLEECGTEEKLEECGTEETLEECGTEERLEECGTEETLEEYGTEEKLEECGTEERLEECGTEERLEECGTEERLEECGTEEKLEECGTEEKLEECGTEVTLEECGTEEKLEECGTEERLEECGTEEKLEECGTEEKLEECGTEEKLEECGTEEKLEECGTEERLEECGTEEKLEECGTEERLEECGTEEKLEECGTEEKLEECGTEERLEECGTEEKLEECGTEERLEECGTEEKLEECGTEEKLEECGTEEKLEECGTEEKLEECGTEEKLEECGTEEKLEECGTEEKLEECGTEEKLEECGTEEKLEECGTEEKLEECGTEEKSEECGTEEKLEECGTEETLGGGVEQKKRWRHLEQ